MRSAGITYRLIAAILRVILRLLYGVSVRGHFTDAPKTLIVANHQSFLDAILLGCFLPVKPVWLVHTTIADRWYFKIGLRFVPHEVTDTTKPMAMKALLSLVESGAPVVIFPEGRITVTGSLMKVYDGPAFVAARTGCTIIPIHIDGSIYSPVSRMSGDFPVHTFPKITLTICPGVTIPMPEAPRARDRRRIASEKMRRVLQDAAYRARESTTLFAALLKAAALHGHKRDILEDINTNFAPITYQTLIKGSLALGRLGTRLTRDREAIGVLMPNANATVMLLFGLTAMRRVPAMLNYTAGLEAIQSACRSAQVSTIVTSRAFVEKAKLQNLIDGLREIKIVYLEDLRKQFSLTDKLWLVLWALRRPAKVVPHVDPKEPALILFTSGSEGLPKGVVLSHDSVLANVAQVNAAVPFSSKDKFLSALPLFHAFGITAGILVPLLKGCRVVLYVSPLHYRTVPEFVYDHDCTVLFTTNTFLSKYARAAHPYDFYNLKYLVVGAEKLSDDVRELCFEKFGLRVLEGYGATECSPAISFNTPIASRMGSVGEILPGMEYHVEPVPGVDKGGILSVRGANVMLGYLKPDAPGQIQPPKSPLGSGWYETGDVVTIEDSYITIQARLKRFAKVAGEMVSLELVERVAGAANRDATHAAIAFPDKARGEAIILFTDDPRLDRARLKEAAARLGAPELAVPRRVVNLDKLPLLGNGKKDYVTLRQNFSAQELEAQV